MLKKSMAAVVMVMVFALALAGCGGSDGVMSKGYGDLFRDKAAINKAVTEIKAKGGGTPLMIFQSMHFGPEFINFPDRTLRIKKTSIILSGRLIQAGRDLKS